MQIIANMIMYDRIKPEKPTPKYNIFAKLVQMCQTVPLYPGLPYTSAQIKKYKKICLSLREPQQFCLSINMRPFTSSLFEINY